jgi:hypothetical protein
MAVLPFPALGNVAGFVNLAELELELVHTQKAHANNQLV